MLTCVMQLGFRLCVVRPVDDEQAELNLFYIAMDHRVRGEYAPGQHAGLFLSLIGKYVFTITHTARRIRNHYSTKGDWFEQNSSQALTKMKHGSTLKNLG